MGAVPGRPLNLMPEFEAYIRDKAYNSTPLSRHDNEVMLSACIDKHAGKKFLICGTGTSLNQYPVEFYENYDGITIGMNAITRLFVPTYYLNFDDPAYGNRAFGIDGSIIKFNMFNDGTQIKKDGRLCVHGTSLHLALLLAYNLGAAEIQIIGCDFYTDAEGRNYFFDEAAPTQPTYNPTIDIKTTRKRDRIIAVTHIIIGQLLAHGVKVENLSENSAIYCGIKSGLAAMMHIPNHDFDDPESFALMTSGNKYEDGFAIIERDFGVKLDRIATKVYGLKNGEVL